MQLNMKMAVKSIKAMNWLQHWAKAEGRRSSEKHLAIEETGLFPEPLHLLFFCDVLELLLGPSLTSGLSPVALSAFQ